ncbi:MAG: type IV secretory system conjugative DNA transfer family protein [Actinomycetota bacterium]|nr:type IV secretory system conjugative DNA transfer family protein [Actinomycetota bacterium]
MGAVLSRLFEDPADPAAAWPRRAGRHLPGPLAFYFVVGGLAAGAGTAGFFVYRRAAGASKDPHATWASTRDLASLIVKRPGARRLVLGRVGGRLVAAEERQSVVVLGPTQSMKTSGFAIPAILEWQGPVVATSVKTDLIEHTVVARSERGRAWVYDPTGCTGVRTSRWSPLPSCTDWREAQRVASWLANAANRGAAGIEQSEFWYTSAATLLAPLLYAAATSSRSISDVVRWVNTQEQDEVADALKAAGTLEALVAAQASWRREPRLKSSVYTTAETVLKAYADPEVARSASTTDFGPAELLDGGAHTLYVAAPSHEQRRLRPLFETLLQTVITGAFERASQRGSPLDPPLLIVLDEAANIAPLPELDSLASTAAAHGIQLVSVFQDLSQIVNRYGERAHTVVNNHRAKIVLSGISDTQTLEYASRLLGDEEVLQSAVTKGYEGARSTTSSTTLRNLAPASVLRGIRPGEGVLVYGHLPPARLRLRPWFTERALARRDR